MAFDFLLPPIESAVQGATPHVREAADTAQDPFYIDGYPVQYIPEMMSEKAYAKYGLRAVSEGRGEATPEQISRWSKTLGLPDPNAPREPLPLTQKKEPGFLDTVAAGVRDVLGPDRAGSHPYGLSPQDKLDYEAQKKAAAAENEAQASGYDLTPQAKSAYEAFVAGAKPGPTVPPPVAQPAPELLPPPAAPDSAPGALDVGLETKSLRELQKKVSGFDGDMVQLNQERADAAKNVANAETEYFNTLEQNKRQHEILLQQEMSRVQDQATKQRMLMDEAQRVGEQQIDTGRYWKNQNVFSKIAAVISGFCFGYAGKGMDYVRHLDDLVRDDINAQQSDRNFKLQSIYQQQSQLDKAKVADKEYADLQAKSVDGELAVRYKLLAGYTDQFARNVQNLDAKKQAEQLSIQFHEKAANAEQSLNELRVRQAQFRANYELSQRKYGPSGLPLPSAAEQTGLKNVEDTMGKLRQAMEDFFRMKGNKNFVQTGLTAFVDKAGVTDEAQWDRNRTVLRGALRPLIVGPGNPNADENKMLDQVVPSAKTTNAAAFAIFKTLFNSGKAAYEANLNALRRAGKDTSVFTPPEKLAALYGHPEWDPQPK